MTLSRPLAVLLAVGFLLATGCSSGDTTKTQTGAVADTPKVVAPVEAPEEQSGEPAVPMATSTTTPTTAPATAPATAPKRDAAPVTPKIEVTDLDAADAWVSVTFQIHNETATPFRLEWAKLTVTMPDGRVVPAVHESGPPYQEVDPGEFYAGGANFCYLPEDCYSGEYLAGRYVASYDGAVLKEADL